MNISIIGMVIGVMVLGAGIYYLVKEWKDRESKKYIRLYRCLGWSYLR